MNALDQVKEIEVNNAAYAKDVNKVGGLRRPPESRGELVDLLKELLFVGVKEPSKDLTLKVRNLWEVFVTIYDNDETRMLKLLQAIAFYTYSDEVSAIRDASLVKGSYDLTRGYTLDELKDVMGNPPINNEEDRSFTNLLDRIFQEDCYTLQVWCELIHRIHVLKLIHGYDSARFHIPEQWI